MCRVEVLPERTAIVAIDFPKFNENTGLRGVRPVFQRPVICHFPRREPLLSFASFRAGVPRQITTHDEQKFLHGHGFRTQGASQ
jgi:hypothetical protein